MYKDLKWLRLTPDRPGRGGTKTGFHTFQQEPINDTRTVAGCHVYRGAWRRDYDPQLYPNPQFNDPGTQQPLALHGYVYPSLTNPAAQPSVSILGQHDNGFNSRIWDFSGGTLRASRPLTQQPAVFQNINGRCFVADGVAEALVLDDRTPAIHLQKNQNLGIGTPSQALQVTNALPFSAGANTLAVLPNLTGQTLAYIFNTHGAADSILHTPDPNSQIGNIAITDIVTVTVVDASYTAISGAPPSPGLPNAPPQSSNTAGPLSPPFAIGTDTISCVSGSSIVTRSGVWPVGRGKVAGLAINFNGFSAVLGATDKDQAGDQFDINGNLIVLGANQAVIYGVYDGPTVTNAPFTIIGCEVVLGGSPGATNTLSVANSAVGTLGYGQSTASSMVPVLVSARTDDSVWFAENTSNGIGTSTLVGVITEYNAGITAAAFPSGITIGPDGNLWFTEATGNRIGRITHLGKVTEYSTGLTAGCVPQQICAGPDGNLWFTEFTGNKIGRITTAGVIAEFPIPTPGSAPIGICLGPDGNLWFTETTGGVDNIGRITPSGSVTEFPIPTPNCHAQGICAGPDGNLWFTENQTNKIGMITPNGAITEFAITTPNSAPFGICSGPDGNLWFTENAVAANKIGRITPTGVVTEFAITTPNARAEWITPASDGNLWFTENNTNKIGRITTAGVVTEYALPAGTGPEGITSGAVIRNLGNISLSGAGLTSPTAGPQYAYAWYDPETGHMSNISPITPIAAPPQFSPHPSITTYQNMTPYFRIDNGYIAYPAGVDATRFSHVMFFRTLSTPGTSTLYPIGSLNPFVGKVHPGGASTRGSWHPAPLHGWYGQPNAWLNGLVSGSSPNYWFDFSKDSDLLLSGGFRAPQFTNEKPMVLLRGGVTQPGYPYAMQYWDRRTWLVNTQEPDVIAFSCDEAQCPLGVPEESFPPTNRLRLPSVDGRVIGMRTVGDMLLITTERWAYIIAGNNESNYRLMKVSASMPGVGTYQMDEFPTLTGAEGEPTTLFYLGRDKLVYQWTTGGRAQPISQPIQDQLDTALTSLVPLVTYQNARVHCVSAWGRRLVIVAPDPGSTSYSFPVGIPTYIWDIDNQVWTVSYRSDGNGSVNSVSGLAPMTTVYGLSVPVNELYSVRVQSANTVAVGSWLRDDQPHAGYQMALSTFPMNFDGKKTRKQIVAVNIHATAGNWTCFVFPNESGVNAVQATFAPYIDPLESIYGAGASPIDGTGTQDSVVLAAQFNSIAGSSTPLVGYRFWLSIVRQLDDDPAKLYAIDVAYREYTEEGEGDP